MTTPLAKFAHHRRRIPKRLKVVVGGLVVGGTLFGATVLPFVLSDRHTTSVEIAGRLPRSGTVGTVVAFDVAADNTGSSNVRPLCVRVTSQPPVAHLSAVFQGLDHVDGIGDRVCGGTLSGSETVSIHLRLTPTGAGNTTLRVVATEGAREVGPARQGSFFVTAKQAG